MELNQMLSNLQNLQMEMHAYAQAQGCLYFDSATIAPRGSAEARGVTLGILSEKSYQLLVNENTRALLNELWAREAELSQPVRRQVELLREDLDELTRIPMEEYVAYTKLTNEASEAWRTAKETDNYPLFAPLLKQVIAYQRRFAAYKDATKPAYDVLLDGYEKGMSTALLDEFFGMLRKELVPLIASVKDQPAQAAFVSACCPVAKQRELSDLLMQLMGIDRMHCALSETEHPFTLGMSKFDMRITTHYHEHAFLSSMYSVVHESGHALYEMDIDDELQYTCLADGASMGMHESQSRFYENMVGHSKGFLAFLSPKLRELFPEALGDVSNEALYTAANRVEPSLIRTEADEVTYPLHVMIRYELEKQLIAGTLSVEELPEKWNALYKEYLGIEVPNNTMGVLQDMHWSDGSFGYFPTYALGSAYAAQFMAKLRQSVDVDTLLAKGELAPITAWLKANVHRYGKLYQPAQLLEKACGEPFQPKYYVAHLSQKIKDVYSAK
ncbi:MAG: carboxypeptidase M32 [Clostridia bacterium]